MTVAPICVAIPTFRRIQRMLDTLEEIFRCDPAPAEILVHVDFGDKESAQAIRSRFSSVTVLESERSLGPGGARNRLMHAAGYEIVVSLDDDSYPIDSDFFAAVLACVEGNPRAGALAMAIIHDGEPMISRRSGAREVGAFVGCGCVYRRSAFLETSGYVPLHPAYGMEEVDLALQLIDRGWDIVHCETLRVRHATDRSHQLSTNIVAAHVKNTLLLAYLRYPVAYWPLGVAQAANRAIYSLGRGCVRGVALGLAGSLGHVWRHRKLRRPIRGASLRRARGLRRPPAEQPCASVAESGKPSPLKNK